MSFEVLAFSRQRVLTTTSQILRSSPLTKIDDALLEMLEFCLLRPRLEQEAREFLSVLLEEEDINLVLDLVNRFELLGVVSAPGESGQVYFNGYQFSDRAVDIAKALNALSQELRNEVNTLLEQVASRPGTPLDSVPTSKNIKTLAIGLGLVDVSEVLSPAGSGKFLTSPRFAPPSVGQEIAQLEDNVFHHSKMLLTSLRFGELRSSTGRGRINDPVWIINALLNRDRIGPCTAIGEDYTILEGEGVFKTTPAADKPGNQFYMELRRREPAQIVANLLNTGTSIGFQPQSDPLNLELRLNYSGPEIARPSAVRSIASHDPETMRRFLEELRT